MNFSETDIRDIISHGLSPEIVESQIARLRSGFNPINVVASVLPGKGLRVLGQDEVEALGKTYDSATHVSRIKFTPASGAASRMFRDLFAFLQGKESRQVDEFFENLPRFPFYDHVSEIDIHSNEGRKEVIEKLLLSENLNFGNYPKALLPFHKYEKGTRVCLEEHLVEASKFCVEENRVLNFHFTISPEHEDLFRRHFDQFIAKYSRSLNLELNIDYSFQSPSTDSIALDLNEMLVRDKQGKLVFRPAGHGALLSNLDKVDSDLIFIKNIDNVVVEKHLSEVIRYKKALGGLLLEIQRRLFEYCEYLETDSLLESDRENEILNFMAVSLGTFPPESYYDFSPIQKKEFLMKKLHRPLRVCGVISSNNTGGGPFWVGMPDGSQSLQLIETSQFDLNNAEQMAFLNASEYSNITDMVLGVRDYKGRKFELLKYSDPEAGIIVEKSVGGKAVRSIELPGLWNGAMSNWNSCFIQVPSSTFNPVKSVNDLLTEQHQL